MKHLFLILSAVLFWSISGCVAGEMISNPVAPAGNDPWLILHNDIYYYCYSGRGGIWVNSSADMVEALQFGGRRVWSPPRRKEYSRELWAPELHFINGKWYIYFAADDGDNANHRMYVLTAQSDNPEDGFAFGGKVTDISDKWAIDGTVLEYKDKLYFIWSGWEGDEDVRQDLYIAPMSDPQTISGQRVLISLPEYDWEKIGAPDVNEGPQVLKNQAGEVFIIYSASGSWSDDYCLGQLKLTGDDPLEKASWQKKPEPVFASTDKVFAPGHACFTKSPDGKDNWIVYHSAREKGSGWQRDTNIKQFTWDEAGNPQFGKPIEKGIEFKAPTR